MADAKDAVNTGGKLLSGAAKQVFAPSNFKRNLIVLGLSSVFVPAAAAAAAAPAGMATHAFMTSSASTAVSSVHGIATHVPEAASAVFSGGAEVVKGVTSLPWGEMWGAAQNATTAAAANDPLFDLTA